MMYGKLAVGVWRLNVTWSPRGPATTPSELSTPLVEEIACEPDVGSASRLQVATTSSGARVLPALLMPFWNLTPGRRLTVQAEASLFGVHLTASWGASVRSTWTRIRYSP